MKKQEQHSKTAEVTTAPPGSYFADCTRPPPSTLVVDLSSLMLECLEVRTMAPPAPVTDSMYFITARCCESPEPEW